MEFFFARGELSFHELDFLTMWYSLRKMWCDCFTISIFLQNLKYVHAYWTIKMAMVWLWMTWFSSKRQISYTSCNRFMTTERRIKDFVLVSSRSCKINSLKQGTVKLIDVVSPLYKNCHISYIGVNSKTCICLQMFKQLISNAVANCQTIKHIHDDFLQHLAPASPCLPLTSFLSLSHSHSY